MFFFIDIYLEKIEDEMVDKQNTPYSDAVAIRAKRKKVKGAKVLDKGNATNLRALEDPGHEVPSPSNSPKHPHIGSGSVAEDIESHSKI